MGNTLATAFVENLQVREERTARSRVIMGNTLATAFVESLQVREERTARSRVNIQNIRIQRVKYTQQHIEEGKKNCSVCLEDYVLEQKLVQCPRCSQLFHEHCILANLESSHTCPLCRYEFVVRRQN